MSTIYITTSPIVTCILDDNGDVKQLFPEINDEFFVAAGNAERIITDSSIIRDKLQEQDIRSTIETDNQVLRDWRMNRYQNIIDQTGLIEDYDTYYSSVREAGMALTFDRVKEHSGEKDELIAQMVHGIDDLQKTINLTGNRLQELYGLHFPELVDSMSNQVTLARIVSKQPNRMNMDATLFQSFALPQEKIDFLLSKLENSLGGDLVDEELFAMQEYAKTIIYTHERKLELEKWIDAQMEVIAPNVTAVAGANVGARLISAMGSLMNLAKTHASKVQIIGAEKALYSALKGRGTPPKHGIIFQIPEIGNAPFYIRGKLSRAFANKIVIAARLDVFDGEFLGAEMREELRALEKELREEDN